MELDALNLVQRFGGEMTLPSTSAIRSDHLLEALAQPHVDQGFGRDPLAASDVAQFACDQLL